MMSKTLFRLQTGFFLAGHFEPLPNNFLVKVRCLASRSGLPTRTNEKTTKWGTHLEVTIEFFHAGERVWADQKHGYMEAVLEKKIFYMYSESLGSSFVNVGLTGVRFFNPDRKHKVALPKFLTIEMAEEQVPILWRATPSN